MEDNNGVRKVEVSENSVKSGERDTKKELGPQASANANEKAVKDSPKKQNQHANNSPNKQRHRSDSGKQNGSNANQNADQRRNNYNRNNKQYRSFDQNQRKKNPSNQGWREGGKPRSGSTAEVKDKVVSQRSVDDKKDAKEKKDEKKRTQSTNSSGRRSRQSNTSVNSNGESFDYGDDFDLDEPFSDSDDDTVRHRELQKPCLQIPRGRIRTLSGTVPPVGYSPKWGGPTMCLSCLEFFDLPDQIERFAGHLLQEHHIVVEEMELIVDPKRYVEYWRQRFAKESIDKIFPKITPDENNPFNGKTEYYFEISERLPEDYSLRQRLAMRRLEEALGCQQREREENTFSMQCIFCRYVARGNRSKIIHHLYMIHHLNLGSPDNLVFVHEYIDHLKEKLHRNECIYCEKTFTDRNILMDHMRKRNHREVNPKNNYYDKFYIINYLELGKRWLDVLAEDFEDTMPTFVDSDDEEEEESWHEWQEDNTDEDQLRVVCLFCDDSHEKVQSLLQHMNDSHKFDLIDYIEKEKLDNYGRMKLLNFLRKQMFNTPNYRARNSEGEHKIAVIPERSEWDNPDNLVPMFGNDHLLWMFESFLEEKRSNLANIQSEEVSEESPAKKMIAESKANTVEGVIPEDLPELTSCSIQDEELIKSLRPEV